MSHESGFVVGVYFLYISSLIPLGLILGFRPVPLYCTFSLPESCFST